LAATIIKGGSGVWGTVPMTAHPTLSEEDARQMVKYILLLK
jgi:cytochrome c